MVGALEYNKNLQKLVISYYFEENYGKIFTQMGENTV